MFIEKYGSSFGQLLNDLFLDNKIGKYDYFKVYVVEEYKSFRNGKTYYELQLIPKKESTETVARKDVRRAFINDFEVEPKLPSSKTRSTDFNEQDIEIANRNYLKVMLLLNYNERDIYAENYIRYQIFKNQNRLKGLTTDERKKEVAKIKKEAKSKLETSLSDLGKEVLLTSYFGHRCDINIPIEDNIIYKAVEDKVGDVLKYYGSSRYNLDKKIEIIKKERILTPWSNGASEMFDRSKIIYDRIEKGCEISGQNLQAILDDVIKSDVIKITPKKRTVNKPRKIAERTD